MKLTIIPPGNEPALEIDPVVRATIWRLYNLPAPVRVAITALLPLGGVVKHDRTLYLVDEGPGSRPEVQTAARPRATTP